MALIVGTKAEDILVGTFEDDCVWGMGGNDVLSGGPGRDTFLFDALESGTALFDTLESGTAIIRDFEPGDAVQVTAIPQPGMVYIQVFQPPDLDVLTTEDLTRLSITPANGFPTPSVTVDLIGQFRASDFRFDGTVLTLDGGDGWPVPLPGAEIPPGDIPVGGGGISHPVPVPAPFCFCAGSGWSHGGGSPGWSGPGVPEPGVSEPGVPVDDPSMPVAVVAGDDGGWPYFAT